MPEDRLWPVSIKGVVFVDEKVVLLLNDRAEWELPGGRLERGETPEACVSRELNEELGCAVAVDKLLLAEVLEVIPQKFVLIVAYHCLLPAQTAEFKLSEEHREVRLFNLRAQSNSNPGRLCEGDHGGERVGAPERRFDDLTILASNDRPRKEHEVDRKPAALEGSRFVVWQLYRLAAGGSRERLNAMFCPSRL